MRSTKGQIEDWAEGQGYDVEIIGKQLARLPDEVDPWSGTVDIRVNDLPMEAVFRGGELIGVREISLTDEENDCF